MHTGPLASCFKRGGSNCSRVRHSDRKRCSLSTSPPVQCGCSALEGLFLAQQDFSGPLPEAWGAPGAFPALKKL